MVGSGFKMIVEYVVHNVKTNALKVVERHG